MPDLHDVAELAAANGHLAVISTIRADGTVQASWSAPG
jgi:surface antigen